MGVSLGLNNQIIWRNIIILNSIHKKKYRKAVKDFTDEEIGVLLDITPANIRMRLTRARRAYEKILNRGDISEH